MDKANYISGAGHIGLISWALFGGVFSADPLPFQITEVSVISGAEYAAMIAAQDAPQSATEVALPQSPDPGEATPDVASAPDTTTNQSAPEQSQKPPQDIPVPPTPPAPPETVVEDTPPTPPSPPEDVAVLAPEVAEQAVPRPADRVAPEPVADLDAEAAPADTTQEAVTAEETGDAVEQEPQEATAPEAATTQIVTEATAAPARSIRPPANRPSAPAPAPTPAAQPAAPTPPAENTDAAVNAALAEALGGTPEPSAPSGPPLSAGERDALRVAVSNCWNVGSLSTDALNTTVVVAVSLTEDGKPQTASIRMLSSSGGSAAAADQAFGAARRAIIRCGANGFDLPPEKYSQWRDIEMTFNPEGMRLK